MSSSDASHSSDAFQLAGAYSWNVALPPTALRKKRKKKSRTDIRNRSGWSCAFYVETSTSCSEREREREGDRREHQSASRDAEFRPITSSQLRDYRSSFVVDRTAQRFSCKSWDGATVGWNRGPGVTNLDGECLNNYLECCFYVVNSGNTLPFRALLQRPAAPSSYFLLWQGRRPKLQFSMF